MKRVPTHRVRTVQRSRAFTLVELLVVIAVAGLLAALAVPAIREFGRSNQQVAATRQMLDAVGRARQLAIANRTTVYMVFLPDGYFIPCYLQQPAYNRLSQIEKDKALELAAGQGRSYALVSLRTIGDQPGQPHHQYLSDWTTLPRGWIFAPSKFAPPEDPPITYTNYSGTRDLFDVYGFARTVEPAPAPLLPLPFPSADAPLQPGGETWILPYIAFDSSGKLVSGQDAYIPLARGKVDPVINPDTGEFLPEPAAIEESPRDNSFTEYNVIHIDWLTGRARLEARQIE